MLLLLSVGAVNCVSGPWSVGAPLVLGLLNMYFPFTDAKFHRFESPEQVERGKTYLNVQGLYYFIVVVLATLKAYHYLALKEAENKLQAYQKENSAFYRLKESL